MWFFALSIVLGSIGNRNLQLTAINGFVNSVAVLLFATSVGRWIDKTPRLKAATTVLAINNFSVAISSGFLVAILFLPQTLPFPAAAFRDDPGTVQRQHKIFNGILAAGSIGLCALSTLASCGTKICISKDWVVVISGKNKETLADINAWMVRLDLICMILSPLLAGQIMTSFGHAYGCIYIALWNIVSFFVEYFVLRSVYNSCHGLSIKTNSKDKDESPFIENDALPDEKCQDCSLPVTSCVHSEDVGSLLFNRTTNESSEKAFKRKVRRKSSGRSITNGVGNSVTSFLHGWRAYYRQQPVFYAGLSLALLYLTVLGLDGITTVFVYSQGLQENVVALSRGAGALVGILGTVAFPGVRKKAGLTKTGIYALGAQLSCNALTALSIWLPGSPFDPYGYFFSSQPSTLPSINVLSVLQNSTMAQLPSNATDTNGQQIIYHAKPMHSILVFLTGIVLARFEGGSAADGFSPRMQSKFCYFGSQVEGLWMVDLTITQIMQEHVADHERGVIGGVQHSLNQCLNMFKDILVILMPDPRTFGLLILISCFSVFSGFISYLVYASKVGRSPSRGFEVSNGGGAVADRIATNGSRKVTVLEVDEALPLKDEDRADILCNEIWKDANGSTELPSQTHGGNITHFEEATPLTKNLCED